MMYRTPQAPLFNGSFRATVLRHTATSYSARVFTAGTEREFLGSIAIATSGQEPTTSDIEQAIRNDAKAGDRATTLCFHLAAADPEAYRELIAPLYREPPTSGEA